MRHTATKGSIMPNHCHLCEKEAIHHITLKNGEELHCCNEHYNQWLCERMGHDYSQYATPKTIAVLGQRYKVMAQVVRNGVVYYAYRGRKGVEESYAIQLPFTVSGKDAMPFLQGKVSLTVMFSSEGRDELDDAGTIGIEYDDDTDGPLFIFKGRKLSPQQLIELLSPYQGFNLAYQLEPRVPDLDVQWFTYEEHVIPDEKEGDHQ